MNQLTLQGVWSQAALEKKTATVAVVVNEQTRTDQQPAKNLLGCQGLHEIQRMQTLQDLAMTLAGKA